MHWRRTWQPTQCSCLENRRDGGAWWAAVHGVAQSDMTGVTWQQQQCLWESFKALVYIPCFLWPFCTDCHHWLGPGWAMLLGGPWWGALERSSGPISESGPLGHVTPAPRKTREKWSLEVCSSPDSFCSAPIFLRLTLQTLELEAHIKAAAAAKSLQLCPTVWPHRRQPTGLPLPWDSPGKSTGVGCHHRLQYNN